MRIALLLFEKVDLLDTGGPYEVFLTAARLQARDGQAPGFDVITASLDDQPVTAFGGMGLIPNGTLDQAMQCDVLIVPGTIAIDDALANAPLIDAIKLFAKNANISADGRGHVSAITSSNENGDTNTRKTIASVCTGAFLLAKAKLLSSDQWTTHWEDIDLLANQFKLASGVRNVRWVDNGQVVTAGGLSSGLDMALHLVERYYGSDLAQRTARQIDYQWAHQAVSR